jgi:hypothetical protein
MPRAAPNRLYAAIREAEAAVAAVSDLALRPTAFRVVLEHLLQSGDAGDGSRLHAPAAPPTRPPAPRERPTSTRRGPQARVQELLEDGFFKTPRTLSDVRTALADRGHHPSAAHVGKALQRLCQARRLRRQRGAGKEAKSYAYTTW